MYKMWSFLICLLFCLEGVFALDFYYVSSPVADVRVNPLAITEPFTPTYPMLSKYSKGLDTQLLYGDCVVILDDKSNSNWFYVETPQNASSVGSKCCGWVLRSDVRSFSERYTHTATIIKKWVAIKEKPDAQSAMRYNFSYGTQLDASEDSENTGWCRIKLLDGVVGYIEKKDLLFHSVAKKYSQQERAEFIRATLDQFTGDPYVWGGASAHDPSQKLQTTGNDCSGLTYLIFNRALACDDFPRNSSSQYKLSKEKLASGRDMQPGDLLFSGKKNESGDIKISHVMVYLGDDIIAESTALGLSTIPADLDEAKKLSVSIVNGKDRFGVKIADMVSGAPCGPEDNRYMLMGRC